MQNLYGILHKQCSGLLLKTAITVLVLLLFFPIFSFSKTSTKIVITKKDLTWIGNTIFQKECGGREARLLTWNKGEEFASLGIGHFIWYPEGREGPFDESFPKFLTFARKRGVKIPLWLKNNERKGCPWNNRTAFYKNINSYRLNSLKHFLIETMPEQSLFIVLRLKKALPKILNAASEGKKSHVEKQFFRVADSSRKLYALIDYVNFKGEGVKATERYNNSGWGLLQVLEEMRGVERGSVALREFARAAEVVLKRRVYNAPFGRNEHRWLPGWKNRVNSYRSLVVYL